VAHPQDGQPAAIFYLFGHPMPYAYDSEIYIGFCKSSRRLFLESTSDKHRLKNRTSGCANTCERLKVIKFEVENFQVEKLLVEKFQVGNVKWKNLKYKNFKLRSWALLRSWSH
jgi:hypothetical protein